MSEQTQEQATPNKMADVFYPPSENATTTPDSQGTTVEAEAVEVEQSTVDKAVDNSPDNNKSEEVEAVSVESKQDEVVGDDSESDEPLYVEIDGKEISIQDFRDGANDGLRQSDYTKKTQALSEKSKSIDAKEVKNDELSKTLSEQIEALEHTFKKDSEAIDWDHLRKHDTAEFLRLKEEQEKKVSSLDAAKEEVKKLKDEKQTVLIAQEYKKLVDSFPQWADPATGTESREKDEKLINAYANDNGLTQEEFTYLTSSNLMIAIHKAAQFDALKKDGEAAEKIVRKAPKTLKPGPKKAKTKSKSAAELFYGTK